MNTTTTDRLEVIRDTVKPTPAERVWRDGIIAREVKNATTDKARLADLTGLGIPQLNRIARTVEAAPADDIIDPELSRMASEDLAFAFGGSGEKGRRLEVKSVRKAKAPRLPAFDAAIGDLFDGPKAKAPKAKAADPKPVRGGFAPAPAGGHVPPRSRKIRATGSVVEFGHATDMGVKAPESAPWVSRCITHGATATFERRGDARYQDGTGFCIECASLA